jgi:hypothetical protein
MDEFTVSHLESALGAATNGLCDLQMAAKNLYSARTSDELPYDGELVDIIAELQAATRVVMGAQLKLTSIVNTIRIAPIKGRGTHNV